MSLDQGTNNYIPECKLIKHLKACNELKFTPAAAKRFYNIGPSGDVMLDIVDVRLKMSKDLKKCRHYDTFGREKALVVSSFSP